MKHKLIILFLIIVFIAINIVGCSKIFIYTDLFSEISNPVDKENNTQYTLDIKKEIEKHETCMNFVMYIGNYVDENEKNIFFEYCSNIYDSNIIVDNNKIVFEIQKPTLDKPTVHAKGDVNYEITEDLYNKIDNYVMNSENEPMYDLAVKSTMKNIAKSAIGEKALENRNIVVKYY